MMNEDELTLYASDWLQPVIDDLIQRPIAPQRWRALRDSIDAALRERAAARTTSTERELRQAARAAISLVLNGLTVPARLLDPDDPKSPAARDFVLTAVRAKVNNLVTDDLLGPEWRHVYESDCDSLYVAETQWQTDIEIDSELRRVLATLRGDEQSMEVLLSRYLGESWSETAARLEKSEPAIRQAWTRLKQRLAKKLEK